MAAAVAVAMPWRSPGKVNGQAKGKYLNSPISVLFVDTVEIDEQDTDDADWDPEIATKSSLTEWSGRLVLEIATRAMLFETDDSIDELTPWGEWDDRVDVAVQFAPDPEFSGTVVLEIDTMAMLFEAVDSVDELIPWLVVIKLEIGKIKKRRYVKRGDGTRRHGRPPDLTFTTPSVPPLTPSATMTAYLLEPDEGAARPEVVLKGLHRTCNLYFARSLRRRTCFPIDDEERSATVARALRTHLCKPL